MIGDEAGQAVRRVDSSGAFARERVTLATNPVVLACTLGLATVLALPTLMGLIRRRGRGRAGGSRACSVTAAPSPFGSGRC